jgi:hypothetical protein
MSVKDRMATDPVCGMKVDIVVGLPGLEPGTSSYQKSKATSGAFCSIGESGLSAPFSVRTALPSFCSFRLRSGRVAARLLHILKGGRQREAVRKGQNRATKIRSEVITAVFISAEPRPGSRNDRTIQWRQQG